MSKKSKSLLDVNPRENVGRDTGLRYDYQYRYAAEAALEILEGKDVVCVYCDYHDDYVVQRQVNGTDHFDFVQVKTKINEKHQWPIGDVFGINEKKATPVSKPKDSFAGKLFYHQIEFDSVCNSVTVLTNVFFVDHIDELMADVKKVFSFQALEGNSKKWFEKIAAAYSKAYNNVDPNIVFSFLKKLKLRQKVGQLVDGEDEHAFIFLKKIWDYSEVPLNQPEALKIYGELVEKVRKKSIAAIPFDITEKELKTKTAITIDDLLSVLTISPSGYQIIKNGGDSKALLSTSRLERFILDRNGDAEMVGLACACKVQWDNWIRTNRHIVSATDLSTMTTQCISLIRMQKQALRSLSQLQVEFDDIARKYSAKIGHQITEDLIFGLFLSLLAKGAT